jgi:hypothetical protein
MQIVTVQLLSLILSNAPGKLSKAALKMAPAFHATVHPQLHHEVTIAQ